MPLIPLNQLKTLYTDKEISQILEASLKIVVANYLQTNTDCENCAFHGCDKSVESCRDYWETFIVSSAVDVLKYDCSLR